jgi:hypothetical protein
MKWVIYRMNSSRRREYFVQMLSGVNAGALFSSRRSEAGEFTTKTVAEYYLGIIRDFYPRWQVYMTANAKENPSRRRRNPHDLSVAKEILRQLKMMDPVALMAWGFQKPSGDENSLTFRVNGALVGHAFVTIILNGKDLYDIEVYKIRKYQKKMITRVEDVYAEDMIDVIDHIVER